MKQTWLEQPERSNLFWLRTITWIALRLGRFAARMLLYPITAYFLVFADRAFDASSAYLRRVLGREARWSDVFRHYHTFASTLLDRIYTFAGQDGCLDVRVHNLNVLETYARSVRGCLLVGAHLGSFEIIRAVGRMRGGLHIKALVYGENSPRITGLFKKLNPQLFEDIVYMGGAVSLIGLDGHAQNGGIIAMLGDRSVHGGKRILCRFFGEPAWFPRAPAILAHILDIPIVLFVCLHRGDGRYDVFFENLADSVQWVRSERDLVIGRIMQRYADRVEYYCRLAPYNWFNFYDFWQTEDR